MREFLRHARPTTPVVLLVTAALALALAGVLPDPALSAGLSALFTVLGAVGLFLIGTGKEFPAPLRLVLGAAALVSLVGYFGVVGGFVDADVREWLTVYPILASMIAVGWVHRRARTSRSVAEAPV